MIKCYYLLAYNQNLINVLLQYLKQDMPKGVQMEKDELNLFKSVKPIKLNQFLFFYIVDHQPNKSQDIQKEIDMLTAYYDVQEILGLMILDSLASKGSQMEHYQTFLKNSNLQFKPIIVKTMSELENELKFFYDDEFNSYYSGVSGSVCEFVYDVLGRNQILAPTLDDYLKGTTFAQKIEITLGENQKSELKEKLKKRELELRVQKQVKIYLSFKLEGEQTSQSVVEGAEPIQDQCKVDSLKDIIIMHYAYLDDQKKANRIVILKMDQVKPDKNLIVKFFKVVEEICTYFQTRTITQIINHQNFPVNEEVIKKFISDFIPERWIKKVPGCLNETNLPYQLLFHKVYTFAVLSCNPDLTRLFVSQFCEFFLQMRDHQGNLEFEDQHQVRYKFVVLEDYKNEDQLQKFVKSIESTTTIHQVLILQDGGTLITDDDFKRLITTYLKFTDWKKLIRENSAVFINSTDSPKNPIGHYRKFVFHDKIFSLETKFPSPYKREKYKENFQELIQDFKGFTNKQNFLKAQKEIQRNYDYLDASQLHERWKQIKNQMDEEEQELKPKNDILKGPAGTRQWYKNEKLSQKQSEIIESQFTSTFSQSNEIQNYKVTNQASELIKTKLISKNPLSNQSKNNAEGKEDLLKTKKDHFF